MINPSASPAHDPAIARAQILGAAVLFSTGGLAIKLCTLTPWQVASFRAAVAAVALASVAPAARRGWTWRTLVVALPYAATVLLFTFSNRNTTAANAIFLQDTAPLYVLLLGPWLLRERIRRRDLWFIAAMIIGLVLLFAGSFAPVTTAPDPAFGNMLATVAGVTWALTLVGLRWLAVDSRGGEAALAAVLAGNVLAAVGAASLALPVLEAAALDWLLIAYLGMFQIAGAYLLISKAMPHISALEASLLLLAEPVLVPLWAWLVLGEATGAVAVAGGILIVLTTVMHAWQARRD